MINSMMMRPLFVTSVIILFISCDANQHKSTQEYRALLIKDVTSISQCVAVDHMYTDLAAAPSEVTKNLTPNVKEVWTLKGCKKGVRKRVEISVITDQSSSYIISKY